MNNETSLNIEAIIELAKIRTENKEKYEQIMEGVFDVISRLKKAVIGDEE